MGHLFLSAAWQPLQRQISSGVAQVSAEWLAQLCSGLLYAPLPLAVTAPHLLGLSGWWIRCLPLGYSFDDC